MRSGLAGALSDDGHEVFAYAAPRDVPAGGRFLGVTILITDCRMPGENGLAFADRFHAACPKTPIILVTSYRTEALDTQAAARRFLRVQSKPLDYEQVHALIHQLAVS